MDWQHMETAPRDGTEVLILEMLGDGNWLNYVVYWDSDCDTWIDPGLPYDHGDQTLHNPDFWAEIPPPPMEAVEHYQRRKGVAQ
jgi:hypothetical protein